MKFDDIPEKYRKICEGFHSSYMKATKGHDEAFETFKTLVIKQINSPYKFSPYHKKLKNPFDYYKFSLDFFKASIDLANSKILGIENLKKIEKHLEKNENVILYANHQSEGDPQAIAILLEKKFPQIGEKIIYVAGERVITDPLAVPFSLGCDLLCIYSKRYIDHPPELKEQKQLHNKKTMELMSSLLHEGGKIIYVAPSGGRDRKNKDGVIEITPFDPQSVEMFYLMAKIAKTPTHFYPLALSSYDFLPPPETVQTEIGETRVANFAPVRIFFGEEFDMERFPGYEEKDKITRRRLRSQAIWNIVNENYQRIRC